MRTKKNNIQNRDSQSKLLQRFDGLENNNPPTNAVDGKKTGILYTSDWIDKLSYPDTVPPLENKYEESIRFIDKLERKGEWIYEIELTFRDSPLPDYGESIVNVNDFFVIKKELPEPPPQCVVTEDCTLFEVNTETFSYSSIKVLNWYVDDEDPCIFYISTSVPLAAGDKIDLRGIAVNYPDPVLNLTLEDITSTPGPYYIDSINGVISTIFDDYYIVQIINISGDPVCYDEPLPIGYFFESTSVVKYVTTITIPSSFEAYIGDKVTLTFSECPLIPGDIYIGSIVPGETGNNITFVDETNNLLDVQCSGTLCVERNSCETCYVAESIPETCIPGTRGTYLGFPLDAEAGNTDIWVSTDPTSFEGFEITSDFFTEATNVPGPYVIQNVSGPIPAGEGFVWVMTVIGQGGVTVSYNGNFYTTSWGYCVRNISSFTLAETWEDGTISHIWMNGLMNPANQTFTDNGNGTYSFLDDSGNALYVPEEGGTICVFVAPPTPVNTNVYNNDVRGYIKSIEIVACSTTYVEEGYVECGYVE